MVKLVVLALCVAAAAASDYDGAKSFQRVKFYNPWGSTKYDVHVTHPTYKGHDGYGYGKFVGGHGHIYVQAKGSSGYKRGDGYGGYGGGYDGYDGGYGGYGKGFTYEYSADVGNDRYGKRGHGSGYGRGYGYGGYGSRFGYGR